MADQGRPDARVERTRTVILDHTYNLLVRDGFSGVSIDEISRQSGVAKTTIYRHWPTRARLLLDACAQLGNPIEFEGRGPFEADLRAALHDITHRLDKAGWAKVLPSIIDAGERDPDVAKVQSTLQAIWAAPLVQIIESAIARGDVPAGTNSEEMAADALGPLYYRRWFSRQPIDSALVERIISSVCRSLANGPSRIPPESSPI